MGCFSMGASGAVNFLLVVFVFLQDHRALVLFGHALGDEAGGFFRGEGDLGPSGQVFYGAFPLPQLVFSQEDGVGNAQLVGVAHFLLKLFLLQVHLGSDACIPQAGGHFDGRAGIWGHGQDEGVRRGRGQGRV